MAKKSKWKSAVSAPKDGNTFLAVNDLGYVAVVKYLAHMDKFVVDWDHSEFVDFAFWRPMVKLPADYEV